MEASLLKKYMQSIEDFVFIEEKIVTYLWLCQYLKVHVNTAKQLLNAFSTKEDVKNKLLVTYMLGGELKGGKAKLLKLVNCDSRDAVRQLFSKVTTDHVFSIQRSGGSFSSTDLFNSYPNFLISGETRWFCPIQPNKAVEKRDVKKRITDFGKTTKQVLKPNVPKVSDQLKKEVKNNDTTKKIEREDNKLNSSEPPLKQKKTSANDKDVKTAKNGSIGNFFNRTEKSEKKTSSPVDNEKVDKKEDKVRKGIGAFFKPGNKNDTPCKEVNKKDDNHKLDSKQKENRAMEEESNINKQALNMPTKKENGDLEKESNNAKQALDVSTKEKKPKSKNNKRKRKKKDDDDGGQKKRKRIVSVLSSDSESNGNEFSDNEMEVEPEQPPPPTPIDDDDEDMIPPTPGRKRMRKQIDKTYTDNEGFIITKKEFVYESCSEDEVKEEKKENKENHSKDIQQPIEQKTSEKKKEISPKNNKKNKLVNNDKSNKQSAITNFFKKKPTR